MSELFDIVSHALKPLDAPKRRKLDVPDEVRRIEVTVELLVPIWVDYGCRGDEPIVTLAPQEQWKLAPVDKRTLAWMEDEIASEVLREATEREAAAAEAEMDRRRDEP